MSDLWAKWRDEGSCASVLQDDPEIADAWTNEFSPFMAEAREICAECPVRLLCLKDAVEDEEAMGIRAGYHFYMGSVIVPEAREIVREIGRRPLRLRQRRQSEMRSR